MRIRFLLVGGLNFLLTNLTLQLLLLLPALPTIAAAAASQLVNALLGFFLYGSQVFAEQSGYASSQSVTPQRALRFGALSCLLLLANTVGINLAAQSGFTRNLGAVAMIPLLTLASYWGQKNWVFTPHR
jgi:putative flippase GtrA